MLCCRIINSVIEPLIFCSSALATVLGISILTCILIESICAVVPILAWPMVAEQPLNARMVVEEIKVGLRVETCNGSVRGFVKWEGLEKMVKELMEEEKGKEVRKKSKEVAQMAKKTMEEAGSSKCTLDLLVDEICGKKT